ncbi:MAG: EpsG family protein [Eubacteriales bacterium]|nr:EpsG family protein [Eubacteriales bacterium]
MTKLLPVFLFGIVMAAVSHWNSSYDARSMEYRKKDGIAYLIMTLVLAGFVGLRTNYNDTTAYAHAYELMTKSNPFLAAGDWLSIGSNPGFQFVNSILKNLGFSTQSFLMFYALVTVGLYLWFIRKHTTNICFSIYLFIAVGTYTFTLAAIKQCVAVAIALVGIELALKKRWIAFILVILAAATFHPYALMFLIVPFMTYKPWTAKGYVVLGVFLVIGFALQRLVGTIVNVTTLLGEEFDASTFTGEGINPFRLAVCAVPLILSFIGRRTIWKEGTETDNVIINLSMLNAEIMFVGLFGTANYFGRLANYFQIFQCLSIPWLMRIFNKRSAELVTVCAIIGYLGYFYYANAINQNFDNLFTSISFFNYVKSLN